MDRCLSDPKFEKAKVEELNLIRDTVNDAISCDELLAAF